MADGRLYWADALSDGEFLDEVCTALGVHLTPEQREKVLENRAEGEQHREQTKRVRKASTLEERLLTALGEASIRSHLPAGLVETVEQLEGPADETRIAKLAVGRLRGGHTSRIPERTRRGRVPDARDLGQLDDRPRVRTVARVPSRIRRVRIRTAGRAAEGRRATPTQVPPRVPRGVGQEHSAPPPA